MEAQGPTLIDIRMGQYNVLCRSWRLPYTIIIFSTHFKRSFFAEVTECTFNEHNM